ncbi:39S ribosomal protein L54, mitochondrial [Carcharodon carcharias]|uniref:39S ribosomal protein L54, mitochondrial n=1 Tax=Carcharodon carcharias TaxID=13397 RepID=UPI001B7E1D87|nr:39S ribosomal protein L54, mitochondrial [Carcharodon carcharias]
MAARSGWLITCLSVRGALLQCGRVRRVAANGYAKKATVKGKGKMGVKEALQGPEVCKDPVILTTHAVGVNIYKQGKDPELRPDTEYPEWLFTLNLGPPKSLDELDPESREYWKRIRKQHMWQHNKVHKGKKF